MKVVAVVLTHRATATGRLDLLKRTVGSLAEADAVQVVDNGSDDGTADLVASWGGVCETGPLTTSGHGTNVCARVAMGFDPDVAVLSDDDIWWRPGWRRLLEQWWADAPDDLALTGCHLEPAFRWNAITGSIRCGGVPGLLRASTGAATWSFRAKDYDLVFGPAGIWQQHQGYGDVMACDRIHERGARVAQIDLAEHEGHGMSTWGNATVDRWGWDVEPIRELLRCA